MLMLIKFLPSSNANLKIGEVLPISESTLSETFRQMLKVRLLTDGTQSRLLPSPLLSDDEGLKLWSQITHMPRYYQTRDEIELLQQNSREIVKHIVPGCTLLDLGSG